MCYSGLDITVDMFVSGNMCSVSLCTLYYSRVGFNCGNVCTLYYSRIGSNCGNVRTLYYSRVGSVVICVLCTILGLDLLTL